MRTVEEGVTHADECWERRFNCAESVLRGFCHARGVDLSEQAMRMATPFGGGVGRSEDLCGALAGGVLALGIALGRTEPEQDRLRSYEAARDLHRSFVHAFGSSECKVLNGGDFQSREHRVRCGGLVREACRMSIEIAAGRG